MEAPHQGLVLWGQVDYVDEAADDVGEEAEVLGEKRL